MKQCEKRSILFRPSETFENEILARSSYLHTSSSAIFTLPVDSVEVVWLGGPTGTWLFLFALLHFLLDGFCGGNAGNDCLFFLHAEEHVVDHGLGCVAMQNHKFDLFEVHLLLAAAARLYHNPLFARLAALNPRPAPMRQRR